ncbi:hypothetical protein TRFO_25601 [Tritrichomonas foetus]|uniref:BAR domain-containing protein n=1 Tax=Tritrichomonas foetus TaxID=1144522 RepID=A0A1J4K559_9EUKA|nr:hypothetical protein TRFO_25601 [Tritrichomonas foetus]|eukprot:OHT06331.1 hypothetical protein TRFO_25601 [Tritrichomonas foetus]
MKNFINKVKETTQIGVQFVKEATGMENTQADPVFDAAVTHLKAMKKRFNEFYKNVEELMSIFPSIAENGTKFSNALVHLDQNSGGYCSTTSNSYDLFFKQTKSFIEKSVIDPMGPLVLKQIENVQKTITELEKVEKEREKLRLLTESERSKLSSGGVAARQRFDQYYSQMMQNSRYYVDQVNMMWAKRYEIIECPLQQFVGIMYAFLQAELAGIQALASGLGGQPV